MQRAEQRRPGRDGPRRGRGAPGQLLSCGQRGRTLGRRAACDVGAVAQGWGPVSAARPSLENAQDAPGAPRAISVPEESAPRHALASARCRGSRAQRPGRKPGFPGRRPPRTAVPGRAPRRTRKPVLPERAVDTAPRGRVSGVFGCEEDSFELGNIGQRLPRTSAGGVRGPGPPPAAQDSGRGARGPGQGQSRRRAGPGAGSRGPEVSLLPSGSVSSSAPPSLAGRTSPRFPGMVLSAFTVLQIKYKAGCVARWQLAE